MMDEEIERSYQALRDTDLGRIEILVKGYLEKGRPAIGILNEGLLGAMAIVGQEFKAQKIWVPDVLLAARNMHRGMEILKADLVKSDVQPRGKLVIGTVKGDIHDIGKNLVSMMMEGAGYQVIDLGIDVSVDRFLEAISQHQPHLVGLSALLTTTMLEMGNIIQSIRRTVSQSPRIIVGGAPVTQKFADTIAADGYAEDAVRAVEIADRLLRPEGNA